MPGRCPARCSSCRAGHSPGRTCLMSQVASPELPWCPELLCCDIRLRSESCASGPWKNLPLFFSCLTLLPLQIKL